MTDTDTDTDTETAETWDPWTFRAKLVRVVDGDTYDLEVDLGFETRTHQRVRLKAVDTAEIWRVSHSSAEYKMGIEQRDYVREWMKVAERFGGDWPLRIWTEKTGKYGRYLADVRRFVDGADLADSLVRRFDLERL